MFDSGLPIIVIYLSLLISNLVTIHKFMDVIMDVSLFLFSKDALIEHIFMSIGIRSLIDYSSYNFTKQRGQNPGA